MKHQFEAQEQEPGKGPVKPQKKKVTSQLKKVAATKKAGALVIRDKPTVDDMIPAKLGLGPLQVSFGSVVDSMDYNDSIPGKRHISGSLPVELNALEGKGVVPYEEGTEGGKQKKGKKDRCDTDDDASSAGVEGMKEATSHGAASKLTRPSVEPRQEQ